MSFAAQLHSNTLHNTIVFDNKHACNVLSASILDGLHISRVLTINVQSVVVQTKHSRPTLVLYRHHRAVSSSPGNPRRDTHASNIIDMLLNFVYNAIVVKSI